MQDSIFTKIIHGDIPCHKIYEDDHVIAFLDINPVQPGHVLVVPKLQVEFVWDLPVAEYQALMDVVQRLAVHLRSKMNVPYVGSRIIGVDVPHAHVHLIPFTAAADLTPSRHPAPEPDHQVLAELAQKLAV